MPCGIARIKWAVKAAVLHFPTALLLASINDKSVESSFSVEMEGSGKAVLTGGGIAPDS